MNRSDEITNAEYNELLEETQRLRRNNVGYQEIIEENKHLRRTLKEYETDPNNQIIRWATCPGCGSRWLKTFMVHDELWKESKLTGSPCILCFEKAIGRRLYIEDLKKTPLCNHMLELGWFLSDRKFGELPSE